MTRAAESVLFNIAEGCGTTSAKDFARFLTISSKSTMELESQLDLARTYGIIEAADCIQITAEATQIRKMLWGLRAKVVGHSADNGEAAGEAVSQAFTHGES